MKKYLLIFLLFLIPAHYGFINGNVATRDEQINVGEFTCDDSGDANPGALSITPATQNVLLISNNDSNGCDLTLGEVGVKTGHDVTITVVSNAGGTLDITDEAGVFEGAGNTTLDVWDVVSIEYTLDRWVEVSESNN